MLDVIAQIFITVFGVTAIGLTQCGRPKLMRFAPICGLISQPCWFYTTYVAEQWGIFALSFAYFSMWLMGFYNVWIKKENNQ